MTQAQMRSEEFIQCHPRTVSVERRRAESLSFADFVAEYVVRNRPVILENAVPQWTALGTWTPDFFKEKYGSKVVDVTYGVQQPLGEVIDAVLASTMERPGPYLHKVIIHQHMPELLPYLSPANIYGLPCRYASPLMPKRFHRPDGYLKLLIGGVGGKFPLMHFDSDNAHAAITEIYGDKEFLLFPPGDTPYVYPHEKDANTSQIDNPDNPDWSKFPLYAKATQYRGIIRPGETVFVPSRWWHTTRVVSTSISVCSNMLHGSNWRGFVTEACSVRNGQWATRNIKRAYLNSAGTIMSAAEQPQAWFPRTALSRGLAKLSPVYVEASSAKND